MTVYPHIPIIANALQHLGIPIKTLASIDALTQQSAPMIFVVPDESRIKQTINGVGCVISINFIHTVDVCIVLSDAGDQTKTDVLVEKLGQWQANIISTLCKPILQVGGPLSLTQIHKPSVFSGGIIVGVMSFNVGSVLSME